MKNKILYIITFIVSITSVYSQQTDILRISLNQIKKDTISGSVVISSLTDSGMTYSRNLYIQDTVLLFNGDTVALKSNILSGGGSASLLHGVASGTDTYTVTIDGVTSYADADSYLIRFTNGNTTTSTLNINSLGDIPLYKNNDGQLIGGDIQDGAEMLCVYNSSLNVFQVIGTSPNTLLAYVTNSESTTITKGQPVYAFGGTGDRLTVKLASNTADSTSAQTVGLVLSTSITAGQKGFIIIYGQLDNLDIFPTSTWADGDAVYLGSTPGTLTKVKPSAPNHLVYLGYVTTASNGNAGRMYVRVQNGYEMDELHNVQISSVADNDIIQYDSITKLWQNKSLENAGIQPTITLTADRALISDSNGKVATSSLIDTTELGYLDNVTSNIQTQLNTKFDSTVVINLVNDTATNIRNSIPIIISDSLVYYVSDTDLNDSLALYTTKIQLNDSLSFYVSKTLLNDSLANYVSKQELTDTSISIRNDIPLIIEDSLNNYLPLSDYVVDSTRLNTTGDSLLYYQNGVLLATQAIAGGGGAIQVYQQSFEANGIDSTFEITVSTLPNSTQQILVFQNGLVVENSNVSVIPVNTIQLAFLPDNLDRIVVVWYKGSAVENGIDSIFTDNTLTGNGLLPNPIKVDTTVIATLSALSDSLSGIISTVSTDVTLLGDGTSGNVLKVDTTVISTITGLSDTINARGFATLLNLTDTLNTNARGFLTTEVDGSITNEGSLTVGAGGANSSDIVSNTSGSTNVTIAGGTGINVTEAGSTITIAATGGGGSFTNLSENGDTVIVAKHLLVDTSTLFVDAVNNRVGVGTSSPIRKFHVFGDRNDVIRVQTNETGSNLSSGFEFGNNDLSEYTAFSRFQSLDGDMLFQNLRTGANDDLVFVTNGSFLAETSNKVTMKNNGNFGIGTSTPNEKLDVRGRIEIQEQTDPSTAGSGLGTIYANSSNSKLYYRDDNGNNYDLTSTATTSDGSWTNSGSVTYLTDSGDNVGVGTSTPGAKFDILGNVTTAGGSFLRIKDTGLDGFFSISDGASGAGNFLPIFEFKSNGNFSIGSSFVGIVDSVNDNQVAGQGIQSFDAGIIKPNGTRVNAVNANLFTWRNIAGTAQMTMAANGNLGIGNTSPTSRLVVKGSGTTSSTSALNVTNSSDASLLYVRDDGKVGIGTSSPTLATLQIISLEGSNINGLRIDKGTENDTTSGFKNLFIGTGYASDSSNIDNNITMGLFQKKNLNNNYANFNFFNSNGSNVGGFGMRFIDHTNSIADFYIATANGGNPITKMTIKANGDVGIGTTAPTAKLEVNGSMVVDTSTLYVDADSNYVGIGTNVIKKVSGINKGLHVAGWINMSDGSSQSGLQIERDDITVGDWSASSLGGGKYLMQFKARNNNDIRFVDDSNNGLYIADGGNVGIGTSTPEVKFHVSGSGNVEPILEHTGNTGRVIQAIRNDVGAAFQQGIVGSNNSQTFFGYTGTNIAFMYTTTYVSTHPSVFVLGTYGNQDFILGTNNTNRLHIKNSGNIGIGTTTPAYTLDVVGDINASGEVRNSGVILTSDARYKKDINSIQNASNKLIQLNPVSYYWNELMLDKLANSQSKTKEEIKYGLIAQEVELNFPEFVSEGADGFKAIDYQAIISILLKGWQEQQQIIESQKTEIEQLKTQIQNILTEINNLKNN